MNAKSEGATGVKRIEPATSQYAIAYPAVESEFEVQARLYSGLRAAGVDVRGEVPASGVFGARAAKVGCRFDMVVFANGAAVAILEVKARPVSHKAGAEATRQGQRYPHFGVPVLFAYGRAGADEALRQVLELIGGN